MATPNQPGVCIWIGLMDMRIGTRCRNNPALKRRISQLSLPALELGVSLEVNYSSRGVPTTGPSSFMMVKTCRFGPATIPVILNWSLICIMRVYQDGACYLRTH